MERLVCIESSLVQQEGEEQQQQQQQQRRKAKAAKHLALGGGIQDNQCPDICICISIQEQRAK